MSKREKEKSRSLDALAKFAFSSGSAPPPPAPKPAPAKPAARPAPPPAPSRSPSSSDVARAKQLAERRAKLDEEKRLKDRRANELARNARLDMSRIDPFGIPSSIRRTGFDRQEASTSQKIHDVLGDIKEKEGRAKAKAKGRRQGGR